MFVLCFVSLQIDMMSEAIDETVGKGKSEEETENPTDQISYCNFNHKNTFRLHTFRLLSKVFLLLC